MTAYDDHYFRKVMTITGIMIVTAFISGVCAQAFVVPWLHGVDIKPKLINECKVEVDRIEADLARVRRECFKDPTR